MRLNDDIVQCETSLAQQSDPCLIRLQTLEARQATGQISNQIEPLSQRERWRCRCPSLVSQRFCALRTADVIRSHTGPQRWITGHYAGLSVDLQDQQAAIVEINRDRPIRIKDERDYPGRS
jgi:hypothetical protein